MLTICLSSHEHLKTQDSPVYSLWLHSCVIPPTSLKLIYNTVKEKRALVPINLHIRLQ